MSTRLLLNESSRSKLFWLLVELVIVFIGVYAAFTLDSLREDQKAEHRQHQFLEALHLDFEQSQSHLDASIPFVIASIDTILTDYAQGQMPRLGHLSLEISFRSRAWEAMMQSGAIDLLDVALILEIENYYGQVESLYNRMQEDEQLSAGLILPQSEASTEFFYDMSTGKLRPPYAWYMRALEYYKNSMSQLRDRNRIILALLTGQLHQLGSTIPE